LITVNIGLQKGIIQPALFSIMVMMAITTTPMTSPLFELVYRRETKPVSAGHGPARLLAKHGAG